MGYTANGEIRYILKMAENINKKKLPEPNINYIKKHPYIINDDIIKYSEIKEEFKNDLPDKYYWKTVDGWLFLYDNEKKPIISLSIIVPNNKDNNKDNKDNNILLFINECIKNTNIPNLRIGLGEIYDIYKKWCENNKKKYHNTQKKFREEFEKFNFKIEKSKGIDINNNHGKRGYNIMVSI